MRYLDTETCGFHGPTVLLQHAVDEGQINLHHIWKEEIGDTLKLIESITLEDVCAFNLAFDWFHLAQTYTTLKLLADEVGYSEFPQDHINLYANLEAKGRNGLCLKPKSALDLLLFARKGPYQSTMDRRNIVIKKVPIQLGQKLADELDRRVDLRDIYFSRKKDNTRWSVQLIKDEPNFVNVVLRFAASSALKTLIKDALGKNPLTFSLPKKLQPIEVGWAPFATAISSQEKRWRATVKVKGQKRTGYTWPALIQHHIDYWYYDPKAIQYGTDDVQHLRDLRKHFGNPEPGDDDSVLAAMVGAVRWRGYALDLDGIKKLKEKAEIEEQAAPKHGTHVYKYLSEVLSPAEREAIKTQRVKDGLPETSTKKTVLETLSKLEADCPGCKGNGCENCNNTGAVIHPVATRAKACLKARQARTKKTLFDKLLSAGRLHFSVNVIGALSGRVSGRDGINATGVQHEKEIREVFILAPPGTVLSGGDFFSYEVSIADARYADPELRKQLLTCWHCEKTRDIKEYEDVFCPHCGGGQTKCSKCKNPIIVDVKGNILRMCKCDVPTIKDAVEDCLRKVHGLFGQALEPGKSYVEVLLTKGSSNDLYDKGKRGFFSQLYRGNYHTLMMRLSIDEETARRTEQEFLNKYQHMGKTMKAIEDRFCSMKQPGGIGTNVEWHDPADFVESLTGFRRYFTLENNVCRVLFELAQKVPDEWKKLKIDCVRRDRVQKVGGAVMSALFAAAFQLQAKNMRAAGNHEIQSTGAILTKKLQRRIWELQPFGISSWIVEPMQVHDEIMCPTVEEKVDELAQLVRDFVLEHRSLIPLLRIDWVKRLKNWSEKG